MNRGEFNEDDLIKCDYQYQIIHKRTSCFTVGEIVFLKCNPEFPIKVHSLSNEDKVICTWKSKNGELQQESFTPGSILQYKYACLLEIKEKYKICLN
jgi:hypothetical protein